MASLKILFYSPDPVYPLIHGNRVRMLTLIRALQRLGHEVHFVVLKHRWYRRRQIKHMEAMLGTTVDVVLGKKLLYPRGSSPFDSWYTLGLGEQIASLCRSYAIDMVICSYIFQSKMLEYLPKHIIKVIDTHDVMGNRSAMLKAHQLPAYQFSCPNEEEARYLKRADFMIGITPTETLYFESITNQSNGVTIGHLDCPKFVERLRTEVKHVGMVASSNLFNLSMAQQFLSCVAERLLPGQSPPFTVHLVGNIKQRVNLKKYYHPKMRVFHAPWVRMHGYVADLDHFYQTMDLIVSPMMCGTGMNIKTVEALAYGMPLLATEHAMRGIQSEESMHHHPSIRHLVTSLYGLAKDPAKLNELAFTSQSLFATLSQRSEAGLQQMLEHALTFSKGYQPMPMVPHHQVECSIIIPAFNQWRLTRACIESILTTQCSGLTYEIILADDCSQDDTINAQQYFPGLRVVRTPSNVGFLRNCNHAAQHARGKYLIFLNNDTLVCPAWLASLYQTAEEDSSIAIVGSKVLYPDRTIQEAGAILLRDASDYHLGRGASRDAAAFNFLRDVDCLSGCSMLVRASFWEDVGGFDERYHHAYFEDYDLMMTARARGMRVVYQPLSEVVHFEHQTYSQSREHTHVRLSEQNKRLFIRKWRKRLSTHHPRPLPWHVRRQVNTVVNRLRALYTI